MANFKYFNGATELKNPHGMANAEFAARFPGVKGKRFESFDRLVAYIPGTRDVLPVERSIEYKSSPSRHDCDARCYNATGKIMRCECACGGKNYGLGAFRCAEAA